MDARLDRTAINKIEMGVRKVTALELSDIAASLGVSMSAFFREPVPALVAHRSSQGLETADSKIDALLAKLAEDIEFVNSLAPSDLWSGIKEIDPDKMVHPASQQDAESLASLARKMMGLQSDEPITNLVESVAMLGLLAFSHDIGRDTADAGTILLDRGGVALVNSHMKVGRRRLALAHELGHYLIADQYTVDWRVAVNAENSVLESRLDRFARALLLPGKAMEKLWKKHCKAYDERSAAVILASDFRVDMGTLATRLKELGLADSDAVSLVRNIRTTQADIIELNLHIPIEELVGTTVPRPFARVVLRLVADERISREKALVLLRGTFAEEDLPRGRERRAEEIWNFVS